MDPLSLGMLVVIGAAFYFLMLRPANKRKKAQAQMMAELGAGTQIMTTAGVFGTIVARNDDDQVLLEIAPGVVITILAAAVARVVEPKTADAEASAVEPEPEA